jgi:hypothetical protein
MLAVQAACRQGFLVNFAQWKDADRMADSQTGFLPNNGGENGLARILC